MLFVSIVLLNTSLFIYAIINTFPECKHRKITGIKTYLLGLYSLRVTSFSGVKNGGFILQHIFIIFLFFHINPHILVVILPGLEPGISGSVDPRLIHWAIGPIKTAPKKSCHKNNRTQAK